VRTEHLALLEEAIRAGDAEARRRIARILGGAPQRIGYLMSAFATGTEPLRGVAEEGLRFFLRGGGTRRVDLPSDGRRAAVFGMVVLEAEYAGAKLSRFLEDLDRFENGDEPVLLDPAVASTEPVLAVDLRGDLRRLLEEVERACGLRWVAFPWFHFLTRETSLDEGGEVFLRLVRAYEAGSPGERRIAACGLARFGLRAVEEVLAEDARSGGERAEDALLGLCAPCGRAAPAAIRSPALVERLLGAIRSPDPAVRRGAAHALWSLAPGESSVREACLARLHEAAGGERAALARILGRTGDGAVRSALGAEAHSPDPLVAAAAIEALTEAGAPPKGAALEALARTDRTDRLLDASRRALFVLRPTLEELSPFLHSTDPEVCRSAARLLPGAGPAGASLFWSACAEETDPFFLMELAQAAREHADLRGEAQLAAALSRALLTLPAGDRRRLRAFLAGGAAGLDPPARPEDLLAEAFRALRDPNEPLGEIAAAAIGHYEGRACVGGRETQHERRDRLVAEAEAAPPLVRDRVCRALAAFLLALPGGPSPAEIDAVAAGLQGKPGDGRAGDREEAEGALRAALLRPLRLRDRDVLADLLDARG